MESPSSAITYATKSTQPSSSSLYFYGNIINSVDVSIYILRSTERETRKIYFPRSIILTYSIIEIR